MSEYIKPGAKEEQQKRFAEQTNAVREKLTKWADKIIVGGFNPKVEVEHPEGEEWEDSDGKMWVIKNGIKQSVRKTQSAVVPWWCPRCGTALTHRLHEKFYLLRGACHNCVVGWEGKMRLDGVWEIYERRTMRNNEKSWLRDRIVQNEDYERTFKNPQIHFENGGWQELANKAQFQSKFDEMHKDITFMKSRLTQIEKEEAKDVQSYSTLDEWLSKNPWETWNIRPTSNPKS